MFPFGNTTVKFTVISALDPNRRATCSFNVRVFDASPPKLLCPVSVRKTLASGEDSVTVTYARPVASDNRDGVTVERIAGPGPGSLFRAGNTVVTYRATDASGNEDECSFNVFVADPSASVSLIW